MWMPRLACLASLCAFLSVTQCRHFPATNQAIFHEHLESESDQPSWPPLNRNFTPSQRKE